MKSSSGFWTPASQRQVDFADVLPADRQIYAGQGPPPPSPLVIERFQQVWSPAVSRLFSCFSVVAQRGSF